MTRTTLRLLHGLCFGVLVAALRGKRAVTSLVEQRLRASRKIGRAARTRDSLPLRTVRTGPLRPGVRLAPGSHLLDVMDGRGAGS